MVGLVAHGTEEEGRVARKSSGGGLVRSPHRGLGRKLEGQPRRARRTKADACMAKLNDHGRAEWCADPRCGVFGSALAQAGGLEVSSEVVEKAIAPLHCAAASKGGRGKRR